MSIFHKLDSPAESETRFSMRNKREFFYSRQETLPKSLRRNFRFVFLTFRGVACRHDLESILIYIISQKLLSYAKCICQQFNYHLNWWYPHETIFTGWFKETNVYWTMCFKTPWCLFLLLHWGRVNLCGLANINLDPGANISTDGSI